MEEITAKISPSRCVDVESGSIIVTIEGHPDDVQASTDDMAANGLQTTNLDLGPGEIIQAPTIINIVINADGDEDEEEESKQLSLPLAIVAVVVALILFGALRYFFYWDIKNIEKKKQEEMDNNKQISVINHENASHDKKSSVGDFDLNDLSNDGS